MSSDFPWPCECLSELVKRMVTLVETLEVRILALRTRGCLKTCPKPWDCLDLGNNGIEIISIYWLHSSNVRLQTVTASQHHPLSSSSLAQTMQFSYEAYYGSHLWHLSNTSEMKCQINTTLLLLRLKICTARYLCLPEDVPKHPAPIPSFSKRQKPQAPCQSSKPSAELEAHF